MFRVRNENGLDPAYPPVALMSVCFQPEEKQPPTCLLAQACQRLWLVVY